MGTLLGILKHVVSFVALAVYTATRNVVSLTNGISTGVTKEDLAIYLAKELDDPQGISYYRVLVQHIQTKYLLEALSRLREMDKKKKITNRAAYYQGILKGMGFSTKFRY